jgi:hypothetical protein
MSSEIINDMTPELLEKFSFAPPPKNIKVYFDRNTKNILAITNESRTDFTDFFETDSKKVENFLAGKDNFNNYKIFLNASNQFEIVSKIINQDLKASMLVNIGVSNADASMIIENDILNGQWKLSLKTEERDRLKENIVNYKMTLFVTSSSNKNFLFRSITIDLNDIINKETVLVPHELTIETLPNKIMLSTVKFFDSYALRNVYESKV